MMSKGLDAYCRGTAAAIALTEGDTFCGALSAAVIEGFLYDPDRRDFVAGFVDVIQARWPMGIVMDAEGRLVHNTL